MVSIKQIWNSAPKAKRVILLKSLGYRPEWAKLSYDEVRKRGGAMLTKDLMRLNNLRKKIKNRRKN